MEFKMKKYYVTFGQNHPLKDSWVEIMAENEEIARAYVFDYFGAKWAFIYEEDKFIASYYPSGRMGDVLNARTI